MPSFRTGLLFAIGLAIPAFASAQTTFNVTSEAGLRSALTNAQNGDTIVFGSAITLTTGDLPSVQRNITIEGAGFALSGNNQYRGLFVAAFATGTATPQGVNVTIQNLTIQNTRAGGGAGGDGTLGGGGGAGLGGALFIANQATVTINNVNLASNTAAGGQGGAFGGAGFSGGGGGGLGGNGGLGDGASGGGGGGVGGSGGAAGGRGNNPNGGAGILTSAAPGGSSNAGTGGAQGGGGAVGGTEGSSAPIPQGGAGGGAGGGAPSANTGAPGGFGGGGGGATATAGSVSAAGGFGGGGGGGTGGAGGFGGGGGAAGNSGGFGGGAGSSTGGGGGAGMGGAIFVQSGGALNVAGGLSINGNAVSGGSGGAGGGSGAAFGAGLFLQGSGTLNFTPGGGQTQAIADTITDLGGSGGGSWALAKNGAGTLVLSGANSFTGGVTVNDGTLSVASDGNLGGGGALTLNNTATLAISSSASFGRQVQIAGAPAFSIGGGQSVAWNGQITNGASAGALLVSGGGALSLTNTANSYSGGTFVRGGSALAVTTDAVLGAAGGGLTLGDATTAGTLRIADGSVFSSTRAVALGAGGGVIDTVGSSSATFGVGLAGTGGLTKNGTGTLSLNGSQSFTGPTAVLQGTFALNGSLPGSVVVYPAGTFRGAGTIGGSLTVTGTIASPATIRLKPDPTAVPDPTPDSSTSIFPQATAIAPSSLLVRGDLVVVNGAALGLTLTSPSTTPLVVDGHGILSGANLDLTVNDPNVTLARVTTYNAITAAQGLSVVNTNITSNIGTLFPGLQPYFTLDKTTLGVRLVDLKAPLATAATNPNALAAGESIDEARPTATGDFANVVRELSVLDDPKLDDALRSIAGEVHGTKIRLVALDAEAFTDTVRDEISVRQRGAEEDQAANVTPQGERPQWWGQFEGQHADFDTRDGADGADGNIGGAAFGVDWNFAGRWFAGGGGGYSRGTLTLDAIEASSRVTAPRVFGYAGFSAGPYSLNFGGSGAWTSYDTSRHLAFGANLLTEPIPGGVDRVAESTQEGTATDQWTEFTDNFKIKTWTYDAKAGWRHARYGRDAFKETGGQSLSLEAAAQAEHSWQADVRFKAFRNTGGIRPHFSGSYRRELGDADTTTEVQLADQPQSGFAVEGLGFGRNTTTVLGGVTVHSALGLEYTLDYEARHAAGQTAQSVHFRLRYK